MPKSDEKILSLEVISPIIVGVIFLSIWELAVRIMATPPYILPSPSLITRTLISDWDTLFPALLITLQMTLIAFITAINLGM